MPTAPRRLHVAAALTAALLAVAALVVPMASAGTMNGSLQVHASTSLPIIYSSHLSAGQFILKKGDATNQRIIDKPPATLTATFDDTAGTFTGSSTFQASYTPNMLGPFNIVVYIEAEIIQVAPFSGTVSNTGAIDGTGQFYLAISVFRTTTGTVGLSDGQNPATDLALAKGSTCRSLIDLHVTGQYDFAARSVHFSEDPFNIPTFPADTRSTGGTAGCTSATASINTQLAGPSNSVDLTFGGTAAAMAPDTPGRVAATAGDGQAVLDGPAPSDYGTAITSYTITPYIGAVAQTPQVIPAAGPPVITGLTNGTTYTFTAKATNAVGTSAESAHSNPVTIGAPAAPGFQSATSGAGSASVTWFPPTDNGSAVTGYTITPYIGSVAQTPQVFSSTDNTQVVTGLTPGTTYTFTVAATNARGTGAASAATNGVTPS